MTRCWQSAFAAKLSVLVAVLSAALTVVAIAQVSIRSDEIFGLRLPARIGGAHRIGVEDYETAKPGLGYSASYRLPGWTIDIYVYDLRLASIPDDPMSEVVKDAMLQAKAEIVVRGERGDYKNVMLRSDYTIVDSAGGTRFLCAMFTYRHLKIRADVDSYLCMTGWKGKFVKFRMTTPRNDASSAVSRRFIEAWSGVLWPQS
jgi:hypothetical protein